MHQHSERGVLGSVHARSVPIFVLPRMSDCVNRARYFAAHGRRGESLHVGRVPALRRVSGAMLVVLLAGGTLTWVAAARTAIESETQRARTQLRLLGADTESAIGEPRRRAAMERARDTGGTALSAKVVLVQDSRRGLHTAGFLLALPVYSSPTLPETVAERRATLRGFVYSPFRAEDFFRTTLADSGNKAFVEVFDGDSPSTDTLLYRTGSNVPPDPMSETRHLPLAGHEWTVRVSVPATALSMTNSPIPWIVLDGVSNDRPRSCTRSARTSCAPCTPTPRY